MTKYTAIENIPFADWTSILGDEDRAGFFLWRLAQFTRLEPSLVFVLLQEALAKAIGPTPSSTVIQQFGRMQFSALWHFPDADPPRGTTPRARSHQSGLLWSGSAWYVSRRAPSMVDQQDSWPGEVVLWGAENMTQFEFAALVDWMPPITTAYESHWPGLLAESYIVMNTDWDDDTKINRLNQLGWRFAMKFHPRYRSGSEALIGLGWLGPLSAPRPTQGVLLNLSSQLWSLSPLDVEVEDFLDEDDADYRND